MRSAIPGKVRRSDVRFGEPVAETEVDAADKSPTGSIAQDATPITRKRPESSIDDADNTTAQEASEISNDEMSEDDAKKIILNHPLPNAETEDKCNQR